LRFWQDLLMRSQKFAIGKCTRQRRHRHWVFFIR
jgi:hypothetical protein